ncbi:MAG: phospholipase D-like domain-containing protein [PVC group bacterium]
MSRGETARLLTTYCSPLTGKTMKQIISNITLTAFICMLSALPASAPADTITLKDGSTLEGRIGAQDSEIVLISVPGRGLLKVSRDSITSIEKGEAAAANVDGHGETVDNLKFLSCGDYYKELQIALKDAKESIQVMMFFINYQGRPGYPANELVNLLVDARKRGVKVEVLLESSTENNITEANQRAAAYLAKNGIDVRFYPVFPVMHVKLVLIDGDISIVGSHNWTLASTKANVESSVLIKSEKVAREYENYFQKHYRRFKPYREGG